MQCHLILEQRLKLKEMLNINFSICLNLKQQNHSVLLFL